MGNTLLWQLLLQVLLIALNAVFASAEIAVISMNDTKLQKLAEAGNKRAIRLARLTSQPARFLATIQVAITLSGFLGSAFAADNFSDLLVGGLMRLCVPVSEKTLDTISVVLITLILSYFTLIFGELVPKRVAMKNAEALALKISTLVSAISKIFAPLVWFLTLSTNAILRLLGIDPNSDDEEVTEEEIRMMVDAGSEKGAIDAEEKELIQNVFEFDDLSADEIATHRTEVTLLWLEEADEQWEKTIFESPHSMFPVCDETVDNVIGILNTKNYFRLKNKSRENVMKSAVTVPYFVPETLKADTLFKNMKASGHSFAVVIDEYGGMTGIITLNDLIQRLVGDFDEEILPRDRMDIERLDSKTWNITGNAEIEEVEKNLGVILNPENEFETFGGYVFSKFGSIPEDGSKFELDSDGLHIKVLEIKEHRMLNSMVCVENFKNSDSENSKE